MDSLQQSASAPTSSLETLAASLRTEPEKKQFTVIPQIASLGEPGLQTLSQFLQEQRAQIIGREHRPNLVLGQIYQVLFLSHSSEIQAFLAREFPNGLIPLETELEVDYRELQQLLARQEFEAADKLTTQKLCELAGEGAMQRKWVYFTEVKQFPEADLRTLDRLWLMHSGGKFGFSVQRELWLALGKNWDSFWPKINWKAGNIWTRYPGSFQWNLEAPRGHLPLSNQLRGVRVMEALLTHPVWSATN
jgi:hypothetical protein